MAGPAGRRQSVGVNVGGVMVGGGAPIVVQSMTMTYTADARATAQQCIELAEAAGKIVDTFFNSEPVLSKDGKRLVFVSNRPADGTGPALDGFFMGKSFPAGGGNLWRVDRNGDGWSEQHLLLV